MTSEEMRGRRVARASSEHCDFCGLPRAQVGKMVISHVGGTPAAICIACVLDAAMALGFVMNETHPHPVAAD